MSFAPRAFRGSAGGKSDFAVAASGRAGEKNDFSTPRDSAAKTRTARTKKKRRRGAGTRAGDAQGRRSRAARGGLDARGASICRPIADRALSGFRNAETVRWGRDTHPLPERSARSLRRPSSAPLRRSALRGRDLAPSVPTTSPSNSRGARGGRGPSVRLAPPAPPKYERHAGDGGSATNKGLSDDHTQIRCYPVAFGDRHCVRNALVVGFALRREARPIGSIEVERVDARG